MKRYSQFSLRSESGLGRGTIQLQDSKEIWDVDLYLVAGASCGIIQPQLCQLSLKLCQHVICNLASPLFLRRTDPPGCPEIPSRIIPFSFNEIVKKSLRHHWSLPCQRFLPNQARVQTKNRSGTSWKGNFGGCEHLNLHWICASAQLPVHFLSITDLKRGKGQCHRGREKILIVPNLEDPLLFLSQQLALGVWCCILEHGTLPYFSFQKWPSREGS